MCPLCPFIVPAVSDLDRLFCHPECVTDLSSTPMHHLTIVVSSAAAGGGLAPGEDGLSFGQNIRQRLAAMAMNLLCACRCPSRPNAALGGAGQTKGYDADAGVSGRQLRRSRSTGLAGRADGTGEVRTRVFP
jgi:hypothetical protein